MLGWSFFVVLLICLGSSRLVIFELGTNPNNATKIYRNVSVPEESMYVRITMWGGGGGGGSAIPAAEQVQGGGGGGSGGAIYNYFYVLNERKIDLIQVGAGGSSNSAGVDSMIHVGDLSLRAGGGGAGQQGTTIPPGCSGGYGGPVSVSTNLPPEQLGASGTVRSNGVSALPFGSIFYPGGSGGGAPNFGGQSFSGANSYSGYFGGVGANGMASGGGGGAAGWGGNGGNGGDSSQTFHNGEDAGHRSGAGGGGGGTNYLGPGAQVRGGNGGSGLVILEFFIPDLRRD